ncbi:MAG TPA: hypothetical protein VK638_58255 [Edaphobacter sp.]|nr:hypothetical protein [Edaphobacter sp.]
MSQKCECGCGEETSLITKTDKRKGHVKGEYARFLAGHHAKVRMPATAATTVVQSCTPAMWQEITEKDILNLRELDDEEAARILDERTGVIESTTRRSFIELGMICREMRERMLWTKRSHPISGVPYHSWEEWVIVRLGVGRRSAFKAISVLEKIRGVSVEDLKEMTRANVTRLAELSTKVQNDPKVIEAAKETSEEGFVKVLQDHFPDQHVGDAPAVNLKLSPETRGYFDDCVEIAEWSYEVRGREDALSNIFAFFLDGLCDREGYHTMTNRDAYEAFKKRMTIDA